MLGWLVGAAGSLPLVLFLYSRHVARKPRLFVKEGTKLGAQLRGLRCLGEVYTPTWWCPFGMMQTIARQLLRSKPVLPWEREPMEYSDGGVSGLDWLHPEGATPSTPLVVFLPGITGSARDSSYLIHAALEARSMGWRCVVSNARGLGGVPLRTPKTYNGGYTDDIRAVLAMLKVRYPEAKKLGCGVSLGGMILFNYLAECGEAESTGLDAAMIVSSPWNSNESTRTLEEFWPRLLFNSTIRQSLVSIVEPYKEMFEKLIDWERLMQSKTIKDFDEHFVVPLFGHESVEKFYHFCSLYYKVDRVPIPLLSLTSADDCFVPPESLPIDDVCKSDNVAICLTDHGGHTAFMQGANPNHRGFLEKLLLEYGDSVFNKQSL